MAASNPACAQLGDFHQHRSDLSEAEPVGNLLHLSGHEEAKAGVTHNDDEQRDKDPEKIDDAAAILVPGDIAEDQVALALGNVPPELAKVVFANVKLKYSRADDGKGQDPNEEDGQEDPGGRKNYSSSRELPVKALARP